MVLAAIAIAETIKQVNDLRCLFTRHFNSQFTQLRPINFARRVHHKVLGGGGFGEGHYVADVFGADEDHAGAFDAGGEASVRGRAEFEGVEEKAELRAGRFRASFQGL